MRSFFRVVVHEHQFVDMQLSGALGNAFGQEHGAHTAAANYS